MCTIDTSLLKSPESWVGLTVDEEMTVREYLKSVPGRQHLDQSLTRGLIPSKAVGQFTPFEKLSNEALLAQYAVVDEGYQQVKYDLERTRIARSSLVKLILDKAGPGPYTIANAEVYIVQKRGSYYFSKTKRKAPACPVELVPLRSLITSALESLKERVLAQNSSTQFRIKVESTATGLDVCAAVDLSTTEKLETRVSIQKNKGLYTLKAEVVEVNFWTVYLRFPGKETTLLEEVVQDVQTILPSLIQHTEFVLSSYI